MSHKGFIIYLSWFSNRVYQTNPWCVWHVPWMLFFWYVYFIKHFLCFIIIMSTGCWTIKHHGFVHCVIMISVLDDLMDLLFLVIFSPWIMLMTMNLLHSAIKIYFFCYIVLKWKQVLALLKLLWGELPREQKFWPKADMRRFSWTRLKQDQRNGFKILLHVICPHQLVQWWEFCIYPLQRLHILVTILFPIKITTKQNGAIIRYLF